MSKYDWQDPNDPVDDEEIIYVSKSELKRDSQEMQQLADDILALSPVNLAKLPLDDELDKAIQVAVKIRNKPAAFRRQINFIGKLLRHRDAEPIQMAMAKVKNQHLLVNQHFHQLETLRDRIIEQGDTAINEAVSAYPQLERSKLRQLARQAKKEQQKEQSPKSARQIFQYLKESIPQED
ncbi:ribosome biogenesis factor YjgA [Gayadomonas joobiniege]|uniref:ribosome biogenesis factor YjgA n=1 Tax=Gayadomonas joobiniege TaxID=1234606 RepID=UPI000363C0A2|nr:ribosome biogenesis factor YjgA [Gayadomonas joobiniege]